MRLSVAILVLVACVFSSAAAEDAFTAYRGFEFRNELRADTPRRDLDTIDWNRAEIDQVIRTLEWLYRDYPNFVAQVTKYGPVPLYKTNKRQLDYINQPAYAGPVYVAFFEFHDALFLEGAIIHELTHIADSFRQFANSPGWLEVIEPRTEKIIAWRAENKVAKTFAGWGRPTAEERALLRSVGLPSFYSASAPAEALADAVEYTLMSRRHDSYDYRPPPDIAAYLQRTVLADETIAYPAGEHLIRANMLNKEGKLREALAEYRLALEADPDSITARTSVLGLTYFLRIGDDPVNTYLAAIRELIARISPADKTTRLHYYGIAANALKVSGAEPEVLLELCQTVNREYPVTSRGPREYKAYHICGDAYRLAGDLKRALAEYEAAIALVPFKRYELTSRIGGLKMALAGTEGDKWKAHDQAMLSQWTALADKGQVVAMLTLGKMLYWGTQTQQDIPTAVRWLNEAHENGGKEASYFLAEIYRDETSDYFNDGLALHWAEAAANTGGANGKYVLGSILAKDGRFDEAVPLLRQAEAEGHPRATYELGLVYSSPDFPNASRSEAIGLFKKAAESGLVAASYALGEYYLHEHSPKDAMQALGWFKKAADKGHVLARYEIGRMAGDKSYSGFAVENPAVAYQYLYLSLNNLKPHLFADLPADKAEEAEKLLATLSEKLGGDAAALQAKMEKYVADAMALPPWKRR